MAPPPLNYTKKRGYMGLLVQPTLDQALGASKNPLRIPIPDRAAKWYALSPWREALMDTNRATNEYQAALLEYERAGGNLPIMAAMVRPSDAGKDEAWAWYQKHADAVRSQEAYEVAQGILREKQQKETQQTRAHQLRQYGPLVMDPVVAASHDDLEQAGIPHSMPLEQFVPPKKGWPTPPMQMATAGQPLAPQFKTYEELNGAGPVRKQIAKLSYSGNMTYEQARTLIEPTFSS
jgi:hypothetical protein